MERHYQDRLDVNIFSSEIEDICYLLEDHTENKQFESTEEKHFC